MDDQASDSWDIQVQTWWNSIREFSWETWWFFRQRIIWNMMINLLDFGAPYVVGRNRRMWIYERKHGDIQPSTGKKHGNSRQPPTRLWLAIINHIITININHHEQYINHNARLKPPTSYQQRHQRHQRQVPTRCSEFAVVGTEIWMLQWSYERMSPKTVCFFAKGLVHLPWFTVLYTFLGWIVHYPLVIVYITMENHNFQWANPL